jgi:hypothetical protein
MKTLSDGAFAVLSDSFDAEVLSGNICFPHAIRHGFRSSQIAQKS